MIPLRKINGHLLSVGKPRSREDYRSFAEEERQLRELDVVKAEDGEVEAALDACIAGFVTRRMHGILGICYRARLLEAGDDFTSLSDLWAPPPDITPRGRFNEANEPLLYAATRPATAVQEMKPRPHQDIVLLVLRGDWSGALIPLMPLGIQRSAHTKLGRSMFGAARTGLSSAPEVQAWIKRRRIEAEWSLQDDLIADIATRQYLGTAQQGGYRLSLGLARCMRTDGRHAGLLFPSVAANYFGHNVALYLDQADKMLQPYEVWRVKLGDRVNIPGPDGELVFNGMVTRRGMIRDGAIVWGEECWISLDELHDLIKPEFIPSGRPGQYTFRPPPISGMSDTAVASALRQGVGSGRGATITASRGVTASNPPECAHGNPPRSNPDV